MKIRARLRSFLWFVALCLSVAATGVVHANMDTSTAAESGQLRVPDPARARVTSLGSAPVVADYYWIQALGLVGGASGAVEEHADVIGDLVELVAEQTSAPVIPANLRTLRDDGLDFRRNEDVSWERTSVDAADLIQRLAGDECQPLAVHSAELVVGEGTGADRDAQMARDGTAPVRYVDIAFL